MEGSSPSPPSMASGASHPHHPHHPFLASTNFSNALGGLSALTSGLSMASMASGGGNGGGAGGGGAHPPLTPSPSSDSPQQVDGSSRPPNSSQQSWTFEEQFKQVRLPQLLFSFSATAASLASFIIIIFLNLYLEIDNTVVSCCYF